MQCLSFTWNLARWPFPGIAFTSLGNKRTALSSDMQTILGDMPKVMETRVMGMITWARIMSQG
jgi:hypothetical protein